jgi:hypothetical protein
MTFTPVHDHEWVQPVRRAYQMGCCDCGLVHRLNFRIRAGHIQFQPWRDPRATTQNRRRRATLAAGEPILKSL